jgi:hypothetical protein
MRPFRHCLLSTIFLSVPVSWLAAGCGDGSSANPSADASVATDSASGVAPQVDAPADAPADVHDGGADTGGDASAEGGSVVLLSAYGIGGGFGAAYKAGAWETPVKVSDDAYQQGGGGIAVTAGKGYVALRPGAASSLLTTTWSGTWPAATKLGTNDVNYVSVPFATATWGAFAPVPGVTAAYGSPLAIAPGVSGATLELVIVDSGNAIRHARLIAGTWSAPALVDGSRVYSHVSLASF